MDSLENALEQAQTEETKVEEVVNQATSEVENVPAEEPAKEEAPAEQPVAETPAKEEAPTEEPVAGTPAVEEAPAEEPIAEAPAEEPAAEAPTEVPAEEEVPAEKKEEEATTTEEPKKVYKTKQEILERVKEIAHGDENPVKEEIDHLKTLFYKLHIAERDAKQKEYLDAGGDPEKYVALPDDDEESFKAEMGIIKEKRAKLFQEQEAEKQENLKRKLAIIEQIKNMVTSPEEANRSYQDFKKLQAEWKEIKAVPAEKANELWRNYQLYVEQFYDLLKLNSEAREYDFRKNLELKTRLCEAAEKLADEPDVISAFHQLQKLHQEYREIGPVAKELREDMWARFKAASTVVNKKHQQHFENLRAKEDDNLARKTALCEKVEAIAQKENKSASDWEKRTREIMDIQAEWKTIGFAPQKMNVKIFERFRAACDDFFGRKAQFFKDMKARFAENAEKKRALVMQAQALQDSTEWKSTSDKLIALQKEWKTIGMVPKKLGDQLWNDFLTACNKFFEARNAANAGTRSQEHANLAKKRDIIQQLKAVAEEAAADAQETVMKLVDEYQSIGHVPYKEKDKLYKEYHAVTDKIYKELNISTARRRLDNFKSNLKDMAKRGEDALDNERARLFRQYENIKQEVQTYENNLGFLNASSKKGSSLIDEMNRKVQKLKDDMNLVREKIKAIDAENREQE
ncbi:MAG: DUF349 domain-containing protein [Prevotella sp.]|nr:DUF349 domain-containing protein [Prevotella sp.]